MQYLNNWIIILIFGFDIIGKNIAFRFRKRKDMFFPFLLQYIIFNQTEIGIYDDGINCIVFDVRTDSQYGHFEIYDSFQVGLIIVDK